MEAFGPMMALGSTALAAVPMFVVLGYLFVLIDRREDRPSKDDKQIGSKLVVWNLTLAGAVLALVGVFLLLKFILGGFKGGGAAVKDALVPLLSGGVTAAAFALGVLPRTNNTTQPQVERFAMGTLAFGAGLVLIGSFYMLVDAALHGFSWPNVSQALAAIVVSGGAAGFALMRHGQLSGWTAAPRPAAPMAPPAGGGYPGGYPQQGGGYPPQGGGGYPPQGGGYPPQGGGGYPPQGGGYPPQGGGGYPPQGGYGR